MSMLGKIHLVAEQWGRSRLTRSGTSLTIGTSRRRLRCHIAPPVTNGGEANAAVVGDAGDKIDHLHRDVTLWGRAPCRAFVGNVAVIVAPVARTTETIDRRRSVVTCHCDVGCRRSDAASLK